MTGQQVWLNHTSELSVLIKLPGRRIMASWKNRPSTKESARVALLIGGISASLKDFLKLLNTVSVYGFGQQTILGV